MSFFWPEGRVYTVLECAAVDGRADHRDNYLSRDFLTIEWDGNVLHISKTHKHILNEILSPPKKW